MQTLSQNHRLPSLRLPPRVSKETVQAGYTRVGAGGILPRGKPSPGAMGHIPPEGVPFAVCTEAPWP